MTRQDYMERRVTHREYYASVAKDAGVAFHDGPFIERVRKALAAGDEHLNTIPLDEWDRRASGPTPHLSSAFKRHGDFWSLAGAVCVLKEAAKQAAEATV
jgi:hypothetical protein